MTYVIPGFLHVIPGLTRNLVSNHFSGYKIPDQARNDVKEFAYIPLLFNYLRTAAIPGSSLPSRYSSIAPPPVET